MCENLLLCFHERSIYLYHLVKTQSSGMMKASETVNKGDLIVKREHNTVNFCERNYDVRLLLPSDLSKKVYNICTLLSFQSYKSLSTIFFATRNQPVQIETAEYCYLSDSQDRLRA